MCLPHGHNSAPEWGLNPEPLDSELNRLPCDYHKATMLSKPVYEEYQYEEYQSAKETRTVSSCPEENHVGQSAKTNHHNSPTPPHNPFSPSPALKVILYCLFDPPLLPPPLLTHP